MKNNEILGAIAGLAGACSTHGRSFDADQITLRALRLWTNKFSDEATLSQIIQEIHIVKDTVAPGCRYCEFPCGGTGDADMTAAFNIPQDSLRIKLEVMSLLSEIVQFEYSELLEPDLLYKTVVWICYTDNPLQLESLVNELKCKHEELVNK